MSIDLHNETDADVDTDDLVGLARFVLDAQGIHPLAELSVLLVDVAEMSQLHERWMDEPGPTDVMAFEMDELRPHSGSGSFGGDEGEPEPGLLGDVVICPEVARRQAASAGHSFAAEMQLLLAHGILHLLGYDHAEPDEERAMFAEQRKLLAGWRKAAAAGADAGVVR